MNEMISAFCITVIFDPFLEAAGAAVLLALAIAFWRRTHFPGTLFLVAVTAYAAVRLVLESAWDRYLESPDSPSITEFRRRCLSSPWRP